MNPTYYNQYRPMTSGQFLPYDPYPQYQQMVPVDPFQSSDYFYSKDSQIPYDRFAIADEFKTYSQDRDNWVKVMGSDFTSDWIQFENIYEALSELEDQSFELFFRQIPTIGAFTLIHVNASMNSNVIHKVYVAEASEVNKVSFSDAERITFSMISRHLGIPVCWVFAEKVLRYAEREKEIKVGSGIFIEESKVEAYKKAMNVYVYGNSPYRAQSFLKGIADYVVDRREAANQIRRETPPVAFVTTGGTSVANSANLVAYNSRILSIALPIDYTGSQLKKTALQEKTDTTQLHGLMIYHYSNGIEKLFSCPGDVVVMFPGGIDTDAQLFGELQNILTNDPRPILLAGNSADEWKEKIFPNFDLLLRQPANMQSIWAYGCMIFVENSNEAKEVIEAHMNKTLKIGPGHDCNANYGFQIWKQMKRV